MDQETKDYLAQLEETVNKGIDSLIIKRNNACDKNKQPYRYIVKKLEHVIGCIHKAQDKLPVEFKL